MSVAAAFAGASTFAPAAFADDAASKVAPAAPAAPRPGTRGMDPLDVDLRLTANADVLLAYAGVGIGGDIGLVKAGPGTIAAGAALEYEACASICWLFNSVTPLSFGEHQIAAWGRASYHLDLLGGGLSKLDLYPLVMVGPTFASSYVKLDDGSAEYRGSDTAIGVGVGVGVSLFVADRFFVGGEARYRYANGTYKYEVVVGDAKLTEGSVQTWSLNGIELVVAGGVRF